MLPPTPAAKLVNDYTRASFEKAFAPIRWLSKRWSAYEDSKIYSSHGINYRQSFLALSDVNFETDEGYVCLVCVMLLDQRGIFSGIFSDHESLFEHILEHRGDSIGGIALKGPLVFHPRDMSISVSDNADFNIELPPI